MFSIKIKSIQINRLCNHTKNVSALLKLLNVMKKVAGRKERNPLSNTPESTVKMFLQQFSNFNIALGFILPHVFLREVSDYV